MIHVLVVDDHPVVRKGLAQIIGAEPSMKVVGEASNAGAVLDLLDKEIVHVVCLDVNLPGKSGVELLPEIKGRFPRLPVLILSQYPERQMAVRAIQAGAAGYLTKDAAPEELVNAIKRLSEGKRYVTAEGAELLAEKVGNPIGKPHESLSNRELRVFTMIASGQQVGSIADTLNLSPKTVSTYRTRVLEKLGLRSTGELIRYALENGITLDGEAGQSN